MHPHNPAKKNKHETINKTVKLRLKENGGKENEKERSKMIMYVNIKKKIW